MSDIKAGDYAKIEPRALDTKEKKRAFEGRLRVLAIEGGMVFLSNEKSSGLTKITVNAKYVRKVEKPS